MLVTISSHNLTWPIRLMSVTLLAVLIFVIVRIVIAFTNPESLWKADDFPSTRPALSSVNSQNFSFTTDPFNASADVVQIEDEFLAFDVPETTLNLKLMGLVTGGNGSAILRTPDNKETGYKVDDEVISDVILKSINKGFVVLSVNGQNQRLTFERNEAVGLTQQTSETKTSPEVPRSNETLAKNVGLLFQGLNLRRSVKNGQFQGYTVKPNRPGVDVQKFGLKKGDVITQIDGQDLTQGRPDFTSIVKNASQQGGVDITVLRNGKPQKIKLGAN